MEEINNEPDVMSSQEARLNLAQIIGRAIYANQSTIITRSGKNAAVIISYADYLRYLKLEENGNSKLGKHA